jgi:hypothetical protein
MKIPNGDLRFILSASLLGALGCGLSEYQQKYEKQQERMNYLDQENQYLGSTLNVPSPKESKSAPPKSFFVCPLVFHPIMTRSRRAFSIVIPSRHQKP